MIEFRHNGTTFGNIRLECEGHAGFGSYGHDIVCAAASILMEATAEALRRSNAPRLEVTVSEDVPKYVIKCGLTADTSAVVRTCVCGFEMLAEEAPEHVSCRRIEKDKKYF